MLLDYDMATNIVRWMKTKINGYKPFTVISNELCDGRLSDTELLIRPSTFVSEESYSSNVLHQRQQHSDCQYHQPHSLQEVRPRFMSITKDELKSGGKRHLNLEELECDVSFKGCEEFTFTFYDFDGLGKVTKDDIAGLVKTIYETLGQSIKVPHYGSKTINVKLTVSPDEKVSKSSDEISSPTLMKTREVSGGIPNDNKWISDLHSSKTREQRKYRQERKHRRRRHSISSSGQSEDREADVSEEEDEVLQIRNPAVISTEATTILSKYKRRSSALQRQELLQIIQANMEKNKSCFQTSRKPTSNDAPFSSHHRNRTKTGELLTKKFVNSWHSSLQHEKSDVGKMFHDSFDTKSKCGSGYSRRIHQRSHSHDLPNNRCSVNEDMMKVRKKHPTTHELKHRFREFEQARAKEQVISWLEQEFSSPAKYCNNNRKKNNNLNNGKVSSKEGVKSKIRSSSNEKHEHHHVHKHVHHHYHHYGESLS